MPVVPCPHCSNSVSLPDPWTGSAYTCPHCRRVVSTAAPPSPPPPQPEEDFATDPNPTPRRRRPTGNPIGDFLTFRLMITPIIIQIVFWIGVVLCVGSGLLQIAASFGAQAVVRADARDDRAPGNAEKQKAKDAANTFSALTFASGVLTMIVGPLVIRILCELDIILFKIHDELKTSNDRQRYRT